MEKGEIIAFNKAAGKGFILNPNNQLYYLFEHAACLDEVSVGDNVVFEAFEINGAINIKRHYPEKTF